MGRGGKSAMHIAAPPVNRRPAQTSGSASREAWALPRFRTRVEFDTQNLNHFGIFRFRRLSGVPFPPGGLSGVPLRGFSTSPDFPGGSLVSLPPKTSMTCEIFFQPLFRTRHAQRAATLVFGKSFARTIPRGRTVDARHPPAPAGVDRDRLEFSACSPPPGHPSQHRALQQRAT